MTTSAASVLNPATLERATYTFTIPDGARIFPDSDPTSVVMQAYTMGQEIDAARAANATGAAQALEYELVRRSVIKVNGKAADQGGDWLDKCSPPVLRLLCRALNKINFPSEADGKAFLDSMKQSV